ncbi:MAG: acyltransferase family protein, partial [Muribaculaceae bacterium]|nr:acyltransferase family protein [Muribaculaceae bacterium]
MENNGRVDVPDIMKGICIIGVVAQHCQLLPDADTNVLTRVWLALNMPLFFFVSGMFLPVKRTLGRVIVHSGHRLLVPWIVFSVAAGITIQLMQDRPIDFINDLHHWLFIWPNVPLYFLRALFIAILVAWVAAKLCRSIWAQAGAMAVFIAASWAIITFNPQWAIHYGWREAGSMVMYMWAGHMIVSVATVERLTLPRGVAVDVMFLALAAACLINPARMRWHYQETQGSWWVVTACAILGVTAVWALACALRGTRPLAYVGRVSLPILVTHYWLLLIFIVLLASTRQVAAVRAIAQMALAVMAYLGGNIVYSAYLNIMYIPGSEELVVYMAAFIGALIGFLWY